MGAAEQLHLAAQSPIAESTTHGDIAGSDL